MTLAPDTYAATVRDVVKHTTPMKHDINCYHLASVYLRGCKTWEEKVERLIALFSEDLSAEEIKYIDVLIAEVLRSKTALETLLGAYPRLLDRLYEIVDLHGGRYVAAPEGDAKPVVAKLNDALAKAAWPAVRATLISNIYGILSAWTPLASSEFMDELRAIGDVFRNLQRVKSVLGGARTIQLVEQRVGRTLSLENLGEQVRDVLEKSEQISILLEIGGHVVGKENRKLGANFIAYIIEDSELDQKLVAEREDDVGRLRLFASLHRAVRDSALGDGSKGCFQARFERVQEAFLKEADFFGRFNREGGKSLEKAIRLVELCAKGTFTPGRNSDVARQIAGHYLLQPDFLPQYLAGADDDKQRAARVEALKKSLTAAGIDGSVLNAPAKL